MKIDNQPDKQYNPQRDPQRPQMPPPRRALMAWLVVAGLALFMFFLLNAGPRGHVEVDFHPDFHDMLERKLVTECEIVRDPDGVNAHVRGRRAGERDDGIRHPLLFRVNVRPSDRLEELLEEHGVNYSYRSQGPAFLRLLGDLLPVLLIFGLLYFLVVRQMRSVGQNAMSFGKSRARMLNRDRQKVTFEHVAGIEEAKDEVQEIVEYLKSPKSFQRLGGRIPRGVLLMGPPGTGKTLLAKAIAGEAEVPFFSISGSDFVEMFVGVGASRVRDMFEQGKKNAPCLIFVDEIDAVGRSRFTGIGGGHDEREQTLNALLVEMDGFETSDGVIILAATNRPDVLDPALLRPGRFDRQITIDLPNLDGREAILGLHSKHLKLGPDVELRRLARGTPGFSGADLFNLLNEAALLAARSGKESIAMDDLEEARDKVRWGRERRNRVVDESEKRITAYHESGHAVVMALVHEAEPLHKITIIPRGIAYLGATMFLPEKEKFLENRAKMKGRLATMMAGRIAESRFIGDITFGASNDLREATRLARAMVCDWGMSEKLGPRTFGAHEEMMFMGREVSRVQDYSEETARQIDGEVDKLLREAYQTATDLIEENAPTIEKLASILLEKESIDGRDAEDIIRFGRVLTDQERREKYPDRDFPEMKKDAAGEKPEQDKQEAGSENDPDPPSTAVGAEDDKEQGDSQDGKDNSPAAGNT